MADLTQAEAEQLAAKGAKLLHVGDFTLEQIDHYQRKLPAPQFELLRAAALGGTMERIALSRSLPIGTVKSRLHRARARLQELINADKAAACRDGSSLP